jgi:hypothetical protein
MIVHTRAYLYRDLGKRDIVRNQPIVSGTPAIPTASRVSILLSGRGRSDLILPRLLLQVGLYASLPRLAVVMLPLRLALLRGVARQTCDGTTDGSADTIVQTFAKILDLALGLLSLALLVLSHTLLAQALRADKPTDSFLGRAHRLVPRAS